MKRSPLSRSHYFGQPIMGYKDGERIDLDLTLKYHLPRHLKPSHLTT